MITNLVTLFKLLPILNFSIKDRFHKIISNTLIIPAKPNKPRLIPSLSIFDSSFNTLANTYIVPARPAILINSFWPLSIFPITFIKAKVPIRAIRIDPIAVRPFQISFHSILPKRFNTSARITNTPVMPSSATTLVSLSILLITFIKAKAARSPPKADPIAVRPLQISSQLNLAIILKGIHITARTPARPNKVATLV